LIRRALRLGCTLSQQKWTFNEIKHLAALGKNHVLRRRIGDARRAATRFWG
jgi:hypothetical protein